MKTVDNIIPVAEKPKPEILITRQADHFKCELVIPNVDQRGYGENPDLALEDALNMLGSEFSRLEEQIMEQYDN